MHVTAVSLELSPDAMYPREYTQEGVIMHSHLCQGFFGRRDPRCRRCLQLLHGSAPRGAEQSTKAGPQQKRFLW